MTDIGHNPETNGSNLISQIPHQRKGAVFLGSIKKNESESLSLSRQKPEDLIVRQDFSLAKRVTKFPAILLGVLFFLALLQTDVSYWSQVVESGSRVVSIPVGAVSFSYQKISAPLNLILAQPGFLGKRAQGGNFAEQIKWEGKLWLKEKNLKKKTLLVFNKLSEKENLLIKKIQKGSQVASLTLIDKSNYFLEKVVSLRQTFKDKVQNLSVWSSIKEKTDRRKEILLARTSLFQSKISKLNSSLLASVDFETKDSKFKKETQLVSRSFRNQVATVWNSKILKLIERGISSYQESWNSFGQKIFVWGQILDGKLVWLENLPIKIRQRISSFWESSLTKADEIATNWQNFLNPQKEISQEDLDEIKKAIADEIAKNLQGQVRQVTANKRTASYGAVVVPSSGDASTDEKIKKNLESQFSDEVSIKFDKSGQAGIVTPIFENDERGDDYVFLLTPIESK